MKQYTEHRCYQCNQILFKSEGAIEAEVICPHCRRINYLGREVSDIGLRGKEFQAQSVNHFCPKCKRLLLRSIGCGMIKVVCKRCKGKEIIFDTQKMRTTGETGVNVNGKDLAV